MATLFCSDGLKLGARKSSCAGVVELADTPDLGSGAARFGGSSPPSRIFLYCNGPAGAPPSRARQNRYLTMVLQRCIVSVTFKLTFLSIFALGACSPGNGPLFTAEIDRSRDSTLCRQEEKPSPEHLAQFIDEMRRQNASFIASAQSFRLQESTSKLSSELLPSNPARASTQSQGITLRLEAGDAFPTLLFPKGSPGDSSLRLDPFLRREHVSSISRIAVSPDTLQVAMIVENKSSRTSSVLTVHRALKSLRQLALDAYDLSWLDNDSLLVSTLTNGRPRNLYLQKRDTSPALLYRAQQPAHEVLLSPRTSSERAFVEVRSPTTSSIFAIESVNPLKLQPMLIDDIPGAGCTFWQGNYTCLSYRNTRSGEALVIAQNKRKVLAQGSLERPLIGINSDLDHLYLFFSTGTATYLKLFSNATGPPITIEPLGPVTTLSPSSSHTQEGAPLISTRSFIAPTRALSLEELMSSTTREAQSSKDGESVKNHYSEEALSVPSSDGLVVPVSLVRPPHARGLLIQTYGAYGVSSHAEYSTATARLLEQGTAVAIAHVRGGGELGPSWHTAGRGPRKIQAVEDLVSVTKYLQRHLGVSPQKTILSGRSAGGWLVARTAISNQFLCSGIILDAPLLNLTSAVSSSEAPLYYRDLAEWGGSRLSQRLSAMPIPLALSLPFHIFMSIPMRDTLISPEETLSWALQARCKQPSGYAMVVHTLPTAGHEGATSAHDAAVQENLEDTFVMQIVSE